MATNKPTRQFDINKFLLTLPGILIAYTVIFSAFFLIKQNGGNNPILFQIGNTLTFRWYGVLITLGVVAALFLVQYLAERRGEDPNHAWGLLPILLVFGILFARLWYVINTWEKYKEHLFSFGDPNFPGFFEVWRGGIAIQGAVLGGIIGLLIYQYFTKIKFLRWADFIIPGLIVAQSLGRWGNFFNNEAYGGRTDLPWGIRIPCEYRTTGGTPGTEDTRCPTVPGDATFHPTFFYESIWNYAVFITLLYMIMYPKRVQRFTKIRLRDGDIFLGYLVFYSIGRFIVESLRTDSLFIIGNPVDGGIRSAQLISIISIFIGSVWFIIRHRRPTRDDEALSVKVAASRRISAGAAAADSEVPESEEFVEEVESQDEDLNEAEEELDEDEADEIAAEEKEESINLANGIGDVPPDEAEVSPNPDKEQSEK